MLRTDVESAVHDLVVACGAAEEQLADAARQVDAPEIAELLATAARRMSDCADAMADDSRSLGDLPGTPDADTQSLRSMLNTVVAALSEDQRAALIDDGIAALQEVEQVAERTCRLDLPGDIGQDVQTCREIASAALAHLRATRARLSPD